MEIKTIEVKIRLTENMLGTVPKDKEIYSTYIAAQSPNAKEEVATVEEIEERGWTGFHKDENGLFVYDYMVKGFIKNAANILKESLGVKNLKSKITDFVFIMPRKIYLGKQEPDGTFERPLRAMTAQGPRVSLSRSDYVSAETGLTFTVKILKHKEVTEKLVRELFEYGQLQGLGQFRNGSFGRFEVVEFRLVL